MSTYLGGFPPRLPRYIIDRWIPERTTVLDPFCGSGTTIVEAKLLGRPAIGIDLNPLAVAIARAKTQDVDLGHLLMRIDSLAREFPGPIALDRDADDDIRVIYHPRTLAQLCYLRDALDPEREDDAFLIGALLGIMHGKARKDGKTIYLSIDMPNTFSMSPDYVRKFVKAHQLEQRPIDAFYQLRQRVTWLLREGALPKRPTCVVVEGDATLLPGIFKILGMRCVGAIVTSPPYLGVLRYGAFNWIRLWFLRKTQYEIDRRLDGTDSMDVYLSFMATFFAAVARITKPGALMALIIGDVVEHGQHVRLGNRLWQELGGIFPFDLVESLEDRYDNHTKTTRIWGEDRKGRATPKDRVLVLQRVTRARRIH